MKTAIAYVLAFVLGPTVGAIGALVLTPVSLWIGRVTALAIGGALTGIAQSFIAVWIGTVIFGWLDVTAGLLMVVVFAVGFLINDVRRIAARGTSMEAGFLVGDICGLVLATLVLLD